MKLVVPSYIDHFHITQLSVKNAIKSIPDISSVHILWNDKNSSKKVGEKLANLVNGNTIFFSDLFLQERIQTKNNWLIQQFAKLSLHKVFPDEKIALVCGDSILRKSTPLINKQGISIKYLSKEHYKPYYNFVEFLLGVNKCIEDSFIAEWHLWDTYILDKLDKFVQAKHQKPIHQVFLDYQTNESPNNLVPGFSESTIYGTFMHTIEKQDYVTQPELITEVDSKDFAHMYLTTNDNLHLVDPHNGDWRIDESFWSTQNIKFEEEIKLLSQIINEQ